jgi:hypothetical protein
VVGQKGMLKKVKKKSGLGESKMYFLERCLKDKEKKID